MNEPHPERHGPAGSPGRIVPLLSASAKHEDLEAEIHAAELAVIERDERVHRNLAALRQGAGQLSRGRLAVAGGVVLLVWRMASHLLRGRAGPVALAAVGPRRTFWHRLGVMLLTAPRSGPLGMLISLFITTLGNSLVRLREQTRTSREAAEAFRAPPVNSVPDLDLLRYKGQWFEIARLPTTYEKHCAGDSRVMYVPTASKKSGMTKNVFSIAKRYCRHDGRTAIAYGICRVDENHPGRFKVTFAPRLLRGLPCFWHDYWVLKIDDDYRSALMGTPDRRRLWLLSRTPALDPAVYDDLVEYARTQGYDTSALVQGLQTPSGTEASPPA